MKHKYRQLAVLTIAAVVASTTSAVSGAAAAPSPGTTASATQGRLANPATALSTGWNTSSDVLVTGIGDTSGFHLFTAREKDAFAWTTLATLTDSAAEGGSWTGEACVTGSGRYAVAVYAPTAATNKPAAMEAGATAAVVDIATGQARRVATNVELAYFNPSCGTGDTATLTRAIGADEQQTDVLTVDAVAGRVTSTVRVHAQLTTPVATASGTYGIAHGALVRVGGAGALTVLGHPAGQVFGIAPAGGNNIDMVSLNGQRSVAQRFSGGTMSTLGSGSRLQLFGLGGGKDALVGDMSAITAHGAGDPVRIATTGRIRGLSRQGDLQLVDAVTAQTAAQGAQPLAKTDPSLAGAMTVTVRATHTGSTSSGTLTTTAAPTLNAAAQNPGASAERTLAPAVSGPNVTTPVCAIGRNNPAIQAFQPSADQVEWAVDQAVAGHLTVSRPANYLKTGQAAYTPQGLFPLLPIDGGGHVPAQVMIGVLAQESNLEEASFHAVPGEDGDPLIADYYGNGNANTSVIDYSKADCGYGIGQVTDNMHVGDLLFSHAEQVAIATDYAANIAAAINILIGKWNQMFEDTGGRSFVNNGSSFDIENWFLALWSYNSGYHPSNQASINNGHFGVGWFNNPANPMYPADRDPFLRKTFGDAAHPADWPYEEKVMGWAETPQQKDGPTYTKPNFGSTGTLKLPDKPYHTFCSTTINNCNPATVWPADPCPAESDSCWWHGNTTFADCASGQCSTEHIQYSTGAAEPGVQRIYERVCDSNFNASHDDSYVGSLPINVVYDLNDNQQYALGCPVGTNGGKFTLRTGAPAGADPDAYIGQVDLHQLGSGYQGHIWFAHAYKPNQPGGDTNQNRNVVGTWTPQLGIASATSIRYDILAHIPGQGANYNAANYSVFPNVWWSGSHRAPRCRFVVA